MKANVQTSGPLFLQILEQLLQLSVVREVHVGERPLRTLHKEAAQCPSRYSHAGIGEQGTHSSI